MAYTVLARRYRSQTFDDVVGQNAISSTLKNAIKSDKVAHAYLFTGTRGVGKTTMARILAKSLNCLESDSPTTKPCLKCDSCISVNTGEDIDVIEIDGASNRGIENVRELRQNASYKPARARFKIYIIDEVHMLTTEAFNALLKILEEPPSHVKFIFATTEPNKVLATIQSRCQRFDFSNISPADIMGQLKNILTKEKIGFEDDCIIALARLANGSMRDGLSLVDQLISTGAEKLTVDMLEEFLGQPNRQKIYELLSNIGSSDAGQTLTCIDSLINSGMGCVSILDSLIESVRDMMVLKASGSAKQSAVILTEAEKQKLLEISEAFDVPALVYDVTLLEKLRWPIKNSDNPRALLESAMLRLALSEHFMNITELLGTKAQRDKGTKTEGVKKKIGTRTNTRTETETRTDTDLETQTEIQTGPVFASGTDIEEIKSNWPRVVDFARGKANSRIADLLSKAVPLKFSGSKFTLGFEKNDEFSMKLCADSGRLEVIESVLSEALGVSVKPAFEIVDNGKTAARPRPAGARTSQKTIDEAANTEAIKTILFELDANIIEVKEESN
ncbi:MAG: DNA polymerase III subunit gamma/tau [Sedimentisphaerales bacterium]|nr:DNA polymerase III subunit gamma/tau [Sedimentisphaerales bacterium]